MNNDWSFHPSIGLGHLKFGMTPEEVQAFEGIYGKVTFEKKQPPPSETVLKSRETFLATLEPDEKKKWIQNNKTITDFSAKKLNITLDKELNFCIMSDAFIQYPHLFIVRNSI